MFDLRVWFVTFILLITTMAPLRAEVRPTHNTTSQVQTHQTTVTLPSFVEISETGSEQFWTKDSMGWQNLAEEIENTHPEPPFSYSFDIYFSAVFSKNEREPMSPHLDAYGPPPDVAFVS